MLVDCRCSAVAVQPRSQQRYFKACSGAEELVMFGGHWNGNSVKFFGLLSFFSGNVSPTSSL